MKRVILLLTAAYLLIPSTKAATLRVPSQYWRIQAAINASVNGDTVLVADGVYAGSGNKNLDFSGKAIVVMSDNGAENCIIDCENDGRGFYFHSSEDTNSVLKGFTVRNGRTYPGGGIFCNCSSPKITDCVLKDNVAVGG